jgi:hypothetical protein
MDYTDGGKEAQENEETDGRDIYVGGEAEGKRQRERGKSKRHRRRDRDKEDK